MHRLKHTNQDRRIHLTSNSLHGQIYLGHFVFPTHRFTQCIAQKKETGPGLDRPDVIQVGVEKHAYVNSIYLYRAPWYEPFVIMRSATETVPACALTTIGDRGRHSNTSAPHGGMFRNS
jgi:hypothetical protein